MTITNRVSLKSVEFGVTPIDDVVDAPTIGTATAGTEQATVTFTPATTGGAATSFTAISTPGSITGSAASSPITVTGLTGGTAYTFKVYGNNASGNWSAVQSAASNSVTPAVATAFDSIATITPSGTGSITFSSIPSTYKHLQIRYITRANSGLATNQDLQIRYNNDSGTNYSRHWVQGNGAGASANGVGSQIRWIIGDGSTDSTTLANSYAVGIIDILDYASTSKYKTSRAFWGYDANGAGISSLYSSLWMSTSAINSINIVLSAGNYSGATFALYGIKGA